MADDAKGPRRRRRRALRTLAALLALCAIVFLVTGAFQLGLKAGLATAAGGYIVYAVPATLLDWPRLTLEDVMDFFGAILSAIVSFFASLLDW